MRKTSTFKWSGLPHLLLVAVLALVGSFTARAANYDLIADPANGDVVAELGEITLKWENNAFLFAGDQSVAPTIAHNGVTTDISDNIELKGFDAYAVITFNPAYTEKGEYVVTIPAGYFTLRALGDSNTPSQEIVLNYTIGDDVTLKSINYEKVDPANNSTVRSIEPITLTWADGYTLEKSGNGGNPTLQVGLTGYNGTSFVTLPAGNPNQVVINNLQMLIKTPTTFGFTFPEGYFNILNSEGTVVGFSPEIVLSYEYVEPPKTVNYETVNPENNSKVTSLGDITITWPEGYTLTKTGEVGNPTLQVGLTGYNGTSFMKMPASNQVVIYNLSMLIKNPTEFGYVIPEGYFSISDAEGNVLGINPDIRLSYEWVEETSDLNYVSVVPENDSKLSSVGEIVVTWPEGYVLSKSANASNGNSKVLLTTSQSSNITSVLTISGNKVTIPSMISQLVSTPMKYSVTFQEGVFNISDAQGNELGVNPEFVLNYEFVKDGPEPIAPDMFEPFPYTTLEVLDKVVIGWTGATAYMPSAEAQNGTLVGTLTKGGQPVADLRFDKEIKITLRPTLSFSVVLGDLATTAGAYMINIPEGFVNVTTADGTFPNSKFSLYYNVTGVPEEVPPTVIEENEPFVLSGSYTTNEYTGEYSPSMTGILTISYDPTLPANYSNRPLLFEANKETPVDFEFVIVEEGGVEKISAFRYDVTKGETYYYLVGDANPSGILLNRASSYTITFTIEEGSLNGGDEPDPGPGEEPGNGPLEAYEFAASNGTYTEITNGTVVFDSNVYDALYEDGIQLEGNFTAIVFGDDGMLSSTVFPGEPTKLPGIPFGFDFPFNGQTFDHFLIGVNGYVMLGDEEIGNIIIDNAPGMGGSMGKFIFGQNVPNVIGSVPNWMTGYLPETEISYATDAEGLTVQFKNMGVRVTNWTAPVPVDYQLKLGKDGSVTMIYNNWATLETADNDSKNAGLQIGLKGDEGKMITLEGAGNNNMLVGASVVYDATSVNTVYVDPTLPDGYTLSFTISQADCEAPMVFADLELETTSTSINATISDPTGQCDGYLMVLSTSFIMWQPEDGVKYEPGQEITTDLGLQMTVLSAGPETEAFMDGLIPNTQYSVGVWPFNSFCANGPAYQVGYGFPPMNQSEWTLLAGPTSLDAAGCTLNSITLSAEGNSEGDGIMVIMTRELEREDNISDDPIIGGLDHYTNYEVGDELEGGGIVVYIGQASDEIVISDLDNSTPYYFAAVTYKFLDYGGGYGYAEYSSDVLYAAGSTVVLPPYEMDWAQERRFVAPAGWTAYWSTDERDGIGVWSKVSGGGIGGGDVTMDYYLRISLGGVESSTGANAYVITSPIYVDKAGYTAEMQFNGEIYPESLRDPAGPLALNDGDYIALSVSKDGGKNFTEAMKYTNADFQKTYETLPIYADLSDYVNEYVQLKFEWKTSVQSYSATGGSRLMITSYTIGEDTGVVEVAGTEEGHYTVYTLSGIKVLDTDNASDLNNLSNGLYIINGKKVMIAK